MTKEHKIIKYNLQDEVNQLHTGGMAYQEIARTIKNNHPEIADLSNLSAMAIQRYLSNKNEKQVIEDIKQGKDPIADFTEEYRKAMRDINVKSEILYDESLKILNSVKESPDDMLKLKAIKEVRDNLDLLRKNQVSLIQFGDQKRNTINNVYLKKEIHIKNLLMLLVKDLCPNCKRVVASIVENEEVD